MSYQNFSKLDKLYLPPVPPPTPTIPDTNTCPFPRKGLKLVYNHGKEPKQKWLRDNFPTNLIVDFFLLLSFVY